MWPYGYTYANVPGDMTTSDHAALVHIGKAMAASNGYKPEQASDLYISSGTTRDYAYGMYRIFSYTFEMSNGDYLDDSRIVSETGRNKNAILYLAERAWCPMSVLGEPYRTARCGAFDDDAEVRKGWASNPDGTDTATTGRFGRVDPQATSSSGPKQLGTVPSGSRAYVTGGPAGANANANDLDGTTTLRSVPIGFPRRPASGCSSGTCSPTAPTRRLPTSWSRASRTPAGTARRSSRSPARRPTSMAPGSPSTPQSMPGRAKPSGSCSRPPTAAADSLVEIELDDIRITRGA